MNGDPEFASISFALLAVIGGLAMLVGGGEILVCGASRLAKRFGMSSLLIGLTVVAFGTSVPELFVSLTASVQGHPDIMLGNVVGSNIANVGLILGLSVLLVPLRLGLKEVWTELLFVVGGSVVLALCSLYGYFPRSIGFVFIVTLIAYTFFTYNASLRNSRQENSGTSHNSPVLPIVFLVISGLVLLGFGSNLFIRGAVDVARYFRVSELIIGLTLAAVGTSLPELASSFAALRRREGAMLIGNVIGSNMFNLFMVLGVTGLFYPFTLSRDLLQRDLPVMLAFSLVLIPLLRQYHGVNRLHGSFIFGSYVTYCFILL